MTRSHGYDDMACLAGLTLDTFWFDHLRRVEQKEDERKKGCPLVAECEISGDGRETERPEEMDGEIPRVPAHSIHSIRHITQFSKGGKKRQRKKE